MDENSLFTTGEVRGITMLSSMSVYRFTRDFPEFFTEAARQHQRGRRFTGDDVVMLLSIESLYHKREGKEKIRAELAGGWRLGNQPLDSKESGEVISRLLSICSDLQGAASEFQELANQRTKELDRLYKQTAGDHQALLNLQKGMLGISSEITRLASQPRSFIKIGH